MQILAAIQQLKHDAFHGTRWNGVACRLGVVMNNLQEIMLCILEDHENTFVLQNDLNKLDYIGVTKLRAEGHFSNGGLGDSRILNLFALLVCFAVSATRIQESRDEIPGLNFLMANSPLCP